MDLDDLELKATRNKNDKTADEMFEELEYEKYEDEDEIKYIHTITDYVISFDLFLKMVRSQLDEETDLSLGISMHELQAINKKVEELGWI